MSVGERKEKRRQVLFGRCRFAVIVGEPLYLILVFRHIVNYRHLSFLTKTLCVNFSASLP